MMRKEPKKVLIIGGEVILGLRSYKSLQIQQKSTRSFEGQGSDLCLTNLLSSRDRDQIFY
jgi:hypothetical protein